MSSILIVDDEEGMRKSLSILFQKEGHGVATAVNGQRGAAPVGQTALRSRDHGPAHGRHERMELLNRMQEQKARIPVIIMTAFGTIDSAVESMRLGATDYVAKPFEYDEIVHRANKAIERSITARDMDAMLRNRTSAP